MGLDYAELAQVLKVMADSKRLQIIDMLSCGELCACHLLTYFQISQPTLSHHMKLLQQAGLVQSRKEGKWVHYRLEMGRWQEIEVALGQIARPKEDCICHQIGTQTEGCCK